MESKDFKKMLDLLSKTFELRKDMESLIEKGKSEEDFDDSDEDNESENEDEDEDCVKSLMNDYHAIMKWCFGKKYDKQTKTQSLNKWKELHPNLPIPRTLLSDKINPLAHVTCLFIDVVPLYYEYKKSQE